MSFLSALTLIVAAAATPAATASDWLVGKSDGGAAQISRKLEGVLVEYRHVPDDYDVLKLTVEACGSSPWWIKDDIDPPGETVSQHGYYVRKVVAEDFHNARLNCRLADGVEDRFMTGFDAAWREFEAKKTNAKAH